MSKKNNHNNTPKGTYEIQKPNTEPKAEKSEPVEDEAEIVISKPNVSIQEEKPESPSINAMLDAANEILGGMSMTNEKTEEPQAQEVVEEEPPVEVVEEQPVQEEPTKNIPETNEEPEKTNTFLEEEKNERKTFMLSFGKQLSEEKMNKLIARLKNKGVDYAISGSRIFYGGCFIDKIDAIRTRKKLLAAGFKVSIEES